MSLVLKATVQCDDLTEEHGCPETVATTCYLGFDSRGIPDILPKLPKGWSEKPTYDSNEKRYLCPKHSPKEG